MILALYVDDFLIGTDSDNTEAWLIKDITKVFKIKVLGLPALTVGITINWTKISKAKKIAYLKDSMQRCIYLIQKQ